MNAPRQLEFAPPDLPLRDDVRRLGALVGDMLAEQVSPAFLEEVASQCGFADQSHFTKIFKRETGTTPGAYRPRRNARTSSARSSGSSIAAKWPPRGSSVQRTTS